MEGSEGKVIYAMYNDEKVVVKQARNRNFTLDLEARVFETIHTECPELSIHFPRLIGWTADNKLILSRIEGVELCEADRIFYRSNSRTTRCNSVKLVRNLVMTTLCVMEVVRRKTGIVHNDLHSSNVMVTKTAIKTFEFDIDGTVLKFESCGYCPVIIDFGSAYMRADQVLAPMYHTNIGNMPFRQDKLADSRILLTTIIGEYDKPLRSAVRTLFAPLHLDRYGWFGEIFVNIVNDMYDVADYDGDTTSEMDSKLAVVLAKMGRLDDVESMPPCAATAHASCNCIAKARECFEKLSAITVDSAFEPDCFEVNEAAVAMKPFVVDAAIANSELLDIEYSKLEVSNGLDVVLHLVNTLKMST